MPKIKENDIVLWRPSQKIGLEKDKVGRVVAVREDNVDVLRCSCIPIITLPKSAVTVIGTTDDDDFLEDANNIYNASRVLLQKNISRLAIEENEKNSLLKLLSRINMYDDILKLAEKQFCMDEPSDKLSMIE
ncbi:hypothetical protein V6C27_03250 [Peptococcaceae bacterium 1198_IL3148]